MIDSQLYTLLLVIFVNRVGFITLKSLLIIKQAGGKNVNQILSFAFGVIIGHYAALSLMVIYAARALPSEAIAEEGH
jgi:hypothetical protein